MQCSPCSRRWEAISLWPPRQACMRGVIPSLSCTSVSAPVVNGMQEMIQQGTHCMYIAISYGKKDLKRHTVLSTVSQSTTTNKSLYIHTQHTSTLLNNMRIAALSNQKYSAASCTQLHSYTQQSQWAHRVTHYKIGNTSQMFNTCNSCINNSKQ